jgi:hypothetical protein
VKSARTALALALSLLAAGCASTGARPVAVALEGDCVATVAELPVNPVQLLPEGVKAKLRPRDFSEVARCLQTGDGGKIAAALFRLENAPSPANLRVIMSEKSGQVLAAAVTTLDADYAVMGRTGFDKFVNRGTSNSVDIVLNDPKVSYVLLTPDNAQVGRSEKTFGTKFNTTAVPAGPVFFVLHTGNALENSRGYSDAGFLSVILTSAGPRPVGAK